MESNPLLFLLLFFFIAIAAAAATTTTTTTTTLIDLFFVHVLYAEVRILRNLNLSAIT
jgi:hypothetical protein